MSLFGTRPLIDVLRKGENNFDILRLCASFAVIFGHAYAIAPENLKQDPVAQILGFDYSGSVAVKFFFFLSGLLVTDSILTKPFPLRFIIRRGFRILPGLWVCLLLTAFAIGPILTELPLTEYLFHTDTRNYIIHNALLRDLRFTLPGCVFTPLPAINGSLWTLPYECICYAFLAVGSALGAFLSRGTASSFFYVIIGISFLFPDYMIQFAGNREAQPLPVCFALGGLAATHKSVIKVGPIQCLALWTLYVLIPYPLANQYLCYIAIFYTAVYVASTKWVRCYLRLPVDASYGVYIYGFIVQQILHRIWPAMGVHVHQLLACIVALFLGIISWRLIEKPCINLGARLTAR